MIKKVCVVFVILFCCSSIVYAGDAPVNADVTTEYNSVSKFELHLELGGGATYFLLGDLRDFVEGLNSAYPPDYTVNDIDEMFLAGNLDAKLELNFKMSNDYNFGICFGVDYIFLISEDFIKYNNGRTAYRLYVAPRIVFANFGYRSYFYASDRLKPYFEIGVGPYFCSGLYSFSSYYYEGTKYNGNEKDQEFNSAGAGLKLETGINLYNPGLPDFFFKIGFRYLPMTVETEVLKLDFSGPFASAGLIFGGL